LPAPAYACAPGAYTHSAPDFCLDLPAAMRAETPEAFEGGMRWKGLNVQWAKKDDPKAAQWRKLGPKPQHKGAFEIISSEPFAGGALHVVYDATQHETLDIYKVPHVEGFAVVEGADVAVRCSVVFSLGDKREDAREARRIAEAHAADFAVCKTLRVR
jgi:hypothetical protein